MPLKLAIVAGEASGDILGAGLIKALKAHYPDLIVEGIAGDLMQAEGARSLFPLERLSVMGLTEVLGRLPELLSIRKQLIQHWAENPPDLFVGIDAPDFTLRLERKLHDLGITTVHYVSPSVWAWRRKRVHSIKQGTDLMLTLLPFEADFYREHQQRVAFVGHPLADQFPMQPNTEDYRQKFAVQPDQRVVALLPGSRGGEVSQLAKPFLEAAKRLSSRYPDLTFLMPAANQARFTYLSELIATDYAALPLTLTLKQSGEVMAASDVILIASGTATLEAMFCKKPMVVAYRLSTLTYAILSRLVKSPWISLPNLLANKTLVPEILQNEVTPEKLAQAVERWLEDPSACEEVTHEFQRLHQQLRGGASEKAALAIIELLNEKKSA